MDFEALVRPDYEGKRWIVCAEVAAATPGTVEFLQRNGADDLFLLCGARGTGEVPDVPTFTLGTSGDSIMGGIRAFENAVVDLPPEARSAIGAFDPDRTGNVFFQGFGTAQEIAGRPVFAPRRPEWQALEDKLAILTVLGEAAIPTADAWVVEADVDALTAAHRELDRGLGTVWAIDNRDGWHGGGEGTRWVRGLDDLEAAVEAVSQRADLVRVMPFLQGIPCSIHGFVAADGVAVFRPVEILTLRQNREFVYGGVATSWDPAPEDRDAMRLAARSVGNVLQRRVAYRGGFSLDGVMTSDGFRPTEVNPRLSVGLGIQMGDIDDIPLGALTRHLIDQPATQIDIEALERRVVAHADQHRASRGMFVVADHLEDQEVRVRVGNGVVEVDQAGPITLSAGPALHGGLIFVRAEPEALEPGRSFAPTMSALASHVGTWLGLDIGPFEPAPDLR